MKSVFAQLADELAGDLNYRQGGGGKNLVRSTASLPDSCLMISAKDGWAREVLRLSDAAASQFRYVSTVVHQGCSLNPPLLE